MQAGVKEGVSTLCETSHPSSAGRKCFEWMVNTKEPGGPSERVLEVRT